jgi:DNA-binding transcriptional regulator YiaG
MSVFEDIDALLATVTRPLPAPAERQRLRYELGLGSEKVAQVLGITHNTLLAWETGQQPVGALLTYYTYFLNHARQLLNSADTAHPPARTPQPAPDNPPSARPPHTPRLRTSGSPLQRSGPASVTDPIAEKVNAVLAHCGGDRDRAVTVLEACAIPDAMRLLNLTRVGGRYDLVAYPPLPDILCKPSPGEANAIWEARPNWRRSQPSNRPGPVAVLDINGAYLSALKTHLPLGRLEHTTNTPHDRRRAGVHLITPPEWKHGDLPNPLGSREEPGRQWVTEPTLRLLLRISDEKIGLCDPPAIHESFTSGSSENLLERFRTILRDARSRAIIEKDAVTLQYVKAMYAKFVSTLGESNHNRELRRPDWMHLIRSQAFANLWSKAYRARRQGLEVVRICGTDELHVQGDWQRVFAEGHELAHVKLKETYEL